MIWGVKPTIFGNPGHLDDNVTPAWRWQCLGGQLTPWSIWPIWGGVKLEKCVILLMVQKSGDSPVEVGRKYPMIYRISYMSGG